MHTDYSTGFRIVLWLQDNQTQGQYVQGFPAARAARRLVLEVCTILYTHGTSLFLSLLRARNSNSWAAGQWHSQTWGTLPVGLCIVRPIEF